MLSLIEVIRLNIDYYKYLMLISIYLNIVNQIYFLYFGKIKCERTAYIKY